MIPQPPAHLLDQWIEEEVFENLYAIWNQSQDGDMIVSVGTR